MRARRPLVASIGAATLSLTLAACGGGGGDEGSSESGGGSFNEGASSEGGKVPDATGPAPEPEGAKAGGEITVLAPDPDDGPASLDPASLWSVTDNGIAQDLLFRSLTTFRPNAETGAYELVPDLATDLGTPNEDFTEWRFTLKDGIKWENGDTVTAEEVANGIKRSFDADTFATGPGTSYSKPYFAGGDKYSGPYGKGGEDFPAVTTEGNDIIMKMSKPFAELDYYAIFPVFSPVPLGDAGAPPDYGLEPLSTGPYKIEKFVPNQSLVLVKNDQWDPETDPARHQYADKYTFEFGGDPSVADKTVLSDRGATTVVTSMLGQNYTQAVQDGQEDNVLVGPQPCTGFVMPNYKKIPELEVRQALAFAYPYEDAWSAGGEIVGVTLANGVTDESLGFGLLPPGMAGREPWAGEIDGKTIQFDPEQSKALLKKAGFEPGEYEVSWVYDASTPEGRAAADQRESGFQEAGFATKKYPYTAGSLYDVWTDPDSALYKKINLLGTAWCQDWPSASTFLPVIVGEGSAYNTGQFEEPEVEAEIKRIQTEVAPEDQAKAWGELEQSVMQDYMPVINTGYYQTIFGIGSDIGGFANDTSVGGAPDYRNIFVK